MIYTHQSLTYSAIVASISFVDGLDDVALGNENTIQELTLILGADLAGLAELSAGEGDGSLVVTFEDKLVLNISGGAGLDAVLADDLVDLAAAKEVSQLNVGAISGNSGVDWEVSVDESHLVLNTLKDKASLLLI